MRAYSRRASTAEAKRRTTEFFRANPHRRFWVRTSVLGESPDLNGAPLVLCIRPGINTLRHVTLPLVGSVDAIVNEDRFLELLWSHLQLSVNGATIYITAETLTALRSMAQQKEAAE